MGACFSSFLVVYPCPIIHMFLSNDIPPSETARLYTMLEHICLYIWIFFLFDGIAWISIGLLIAADDTIFIMYMNAASAWIFGLVPIYICAVHYNWGPESSWFLYNFYEGMNALCFYIRTSKGKWKKNAYMANAANHAKNS